MYKLKVIIASTRPGRAGLPVAEWFFKFAKNNTKEFEVELLDLLKINLPFLDEPNHPKLMQYTQEHTKAWSKIIGESDAFVFVVPEYNYGPPAALINAIDFVYNEWNYKAAGFVSYGGISGGLRSVQTLKLVMTTLKIVPLMEGVSISMVTEHIDEQKNFVATSFHEKTATIMLKELEKWTGALVQLRGKQTLRK
jgi:NAD(P)H-dependent FMN reductase